MGEIGNWDFKVGDMVGWSNKKTGQPYRGQIVSLHGPPYPRAVIKMAGCTVKKAVTSVVSLSLLVHAGPKRNHRRNATNMKVKEKDLSPVPQGEIVYCYRCKINGHEVPATKCKVMHTPNGGKYFRGWCDSCLTTSAARWEPPGTKKPVYVLGRPFRPGEEVEVHFTGKVLHYVPKKPENVVIAVGRQGYNVKIEWVKKTIKGDING
jgi:hypothetical protein